MDGKRTGKRARLATPVILGSLVAAVALTAGAAAAATADTPCQPGSGPNLAGRHLTSTDVANYEPGKLRCANLTGADLSARWIRSTSPARSCARPTCSMPA